MTTTMPLAAGTWSVDAATRASFAVRNFGVNTVRGTIDVTAGTLEVHATGRPVRLSGALDPASINTGNSQRDKDLRSKRFLNVAEHPSMEVMADEFEPTADGWRARAVLRVAGGDAPLWIDGRLDGEHTGDRLSVTATARLDRLAAGIRAPRFLVGRWVDIMISARMTIRVP
jgi:polyisoprenoid-binding protein YceI